MKYLYALAGGVFAYYFVKGTHQALGEKAYLKWVDGLPSTAKLRR